MDLATRLRQELNRRNIRPVDLAKVIGLSPQMAGQIKSGKRGLSRHIEAIAKFLEVSLDAPSYDDKTGMFGVEGSRPKLPAPQEMTHAAQRQSEIAPGHTPFSQRQAEEIALILLKIAGHLKELATETITGIVPRRRVSSAGDRKSRRHASPRKRRPPRAS